MPFPHSAHLFCRVIDNFGDIGVCWRLARQLASEHRVQVSLWVDDLASFQRICPSINPRTAIQVIENVVVRLWADEVGDWEKHVIPDLVIEAFACDLPPGYILAMSQRSPRPAWINLEYLSAEDWVETCHAKPSPHPVLPLTKYFFFPGFTACTGGLLCEQELLNRKGAFQADRQAVQTFLHSLDIIPDNETHFVSLFCYPNAPVKELFYAWEQGAQPLLCLVPEGVASNQVAEFLGHPAVAGAVNRRNQLTVKVIPFLSQPDYDRLLWSCDLNFVRGEDSLVRAQWAGRPFVWQIYPQQEDAHWPKLDAFLKRYGDGLPEQVKQELVAGWRWWNGASGCELDWQAWSRQLSELQEHTRQWSEGLRRHGDLASNLLRFVEKIG